MTFNAESYPVKRINIYTIRSSQARANNKQLRETFMMLASIKYTDGSVHRNLVTNFC